MKEELTTLETAREDRWFYLICFAFFLCLMIGIWLWVAGTFSEEREATRQSTMAAVADDVAIDLASSADNAYRRLGILAQELEARGGIDSKAAVRHVLDHFDPATFSSLRLITADGRIITPPDTVQKDNSTFNMLSNSVCLMRPAAVDRLTCSYSLYGNFALTQPVVSQAGITAWLEGQFDLKNFLGLWSRKADTRGGAIFILNRDGQILFRAGRAADRLSALLKTQESSLAEQFSLAQDVFVRLSGIEGQPEVCLTLHPVPNSNFLVALAIPQTYFTGKTNRAETLLQLSLGFLLAGAFGFFLAVCHRYYKRARLAGRLTDNLQLVIEAERILFAAATDESQMNEGLHRLCGLMHCQGIAFKIYGHDGKKDAFFYWFADEKLGKHIVGLLAAGELIRRRFTDPAVHSMIIRSAAELVRALPEAAPLGGAVRNGAAVPIRDLQNRLAGLVCTVNCDNPDLTLSTLQPLALGFTGYMTTHDAYQKVKALSERDVLTGLHNRNSFENALPEYAVAKAPLVCVYADANGLHAVNNTYGHAAGDRLIKAIAATMKNAFGDEHTYRTGGDEFVAFLPNGNIAFTEAEIKDLQRSMRAAGYDAAFGCAAVSERPDGRVPVQQLLATAEKAMYLDKKSDGGIHRHRTVNTEQTSPAS